MSEEKHAERAEVSSLPPWFHRMDENGETPLSRALQSYFPFLAEFSVLKEKSSYERGNQMETPSDDLENAVYWGLQGKVSQLLADGADASKPTQQGKTPLMLAICNGHEETVEALIQHGADLNEKTPEGVTCLHWAALTGEKKIAEILIEHGAEVNPVEEAEAACSCPSPATTALFMGYNDVYDLFHEKGGKLY